MSYQLEKARLKRSHPGWPVYRLKHLVRLVGGGTPSKENSEYWDNGTIPWVSPKDMKRRVVSETEDYVTDTAVRESATSFVAPGTPLMVVRSGILRHTIPVALAGCRLTLNQDMKAFHLSKLIYPRYFLYWVEGQCHDLLLEWRQLGATVESIDTNWMLNGRIALPDLDTQKAIADFLDRETARVDQLIEKKQRLVELVKESELAHIAHKFSQLDARTWRVRHLGKLRNGSGFPVELQGDPSQDIPFFKVKHLKVHGLDAAITETNDTVSEETAKSLRATVFPKGTIVFAKIGAALLLGRFSMLGRPACIDNNMSAFVPNESLIEPNFALLGLSQADMTTMVQPGAVPSLSTEAFYSFGIPLPSKEAQRDFVDEFRSWRSTNIQIVAKTQQSIARLQEFRSALITAAATGQIDVSTWGKRGETDRRLDQIAEEMAAEAGGQQDMEARA